MPHRKLAEVTGVALGNIKNVIEGLREAGFIIQINATTLKLQNKHALLDRWIAGYREILRPALQLGIYKFWDKNKIQNWQTLKVEVGEDMWGGEPAGELLTNYLTAADLTLYTNNKTALVTKWTIIPDEKSPLHIYKKFWKDEMLDKEKLVSPMLVYADLILTDDPRCQETAQMIYDKYLIDEFK